MTKAIYPKLALQGMVKNKQLYMPYLLTCILMSMMQYILGYLSESSLIKQMHGGTNLVMIMSLGEFVTAVFAAIFLIYTNSFLMRRRLKEFGLYNILGMNKKNISVILFFETLFTYIICLAGGVGLGIGLSKLCELELVKLIEGQSDYIFRVPVKAIIPQFIIFGIIFFIIYLNSLRRLGFARPIELLRSENLGEKPPKANYVVGILGLLILAAAYFIALKIEQPLSALVWFMFAVILVIIGSYLTFVAGSVMICRILQKNKNFYYKKENFISISSMTFRMKRNGAGLASICVLLTMVLVLLSSTSCLYFGAEDCILAQNPTEIGFFACHEGYYEKERDFVNEIEASIFESVDNDKIKMDTLKTYYEYCITGLLEEGVINISLNSKSDLSFVSYDSICEAAFIDIDDYNRMFGTDYKLGDLEALVTTVKTPKNSIKDTIQVGTVAFDIVGNIDRETLDLNGSSLASVSSRIFIFVNDIDAVASQLVDYYDYNGDPMLLAREYCLFDTNATEEENLQIRDAVSEAGQKVYAERGVPCTNLYASSRSEQKDDFYSTFGALFFVGIMLSLLFMVSAVLIIYYKQICEGYEDKARFAIMQSVGMSKKDIRKTINAQMVMVFLLPIIVAAIHSCFAFPVINKLLMLFSLFNLRLHILTMAGCVSMCALIYVIVYKLTSNSYYRIVSEAK